jgi:ABC-type Fe3+-hydroxamate transport system substrate-binding protein
VRFFQGIPKKSGMPFYFSSMSQVTFTDQMGCAVTLSYPPRRIVSLVPSITELLGYLALHEQVVGITKFCVHPAQWRKVKTIVGGTKNFRFDVIRSLRPDLIIGNKEENYREGIDELKQQFPVWMSDVVTLTDALHMIGEVGKITGCPEQGQALSKQIEARFSQLKPLPPLRALYLIWKDPWMGAGQNTFIHSMLTAAGLINVLQNQPRYPRLSDSDIRTLNPEVVLLSSEPYPFREKHVVQLQALVPAAKIWLVAGDMFSWYGSRMLQFADYIEQLKDRL